MSVEIRAYHPVSDHQACRGLWAELTMAYRRLYDITEAADNDPGADFENYLTRVNLSGMWVALEDDTIAGFTGLIVDERHGEVEPLVVADSQQRRGIGTALLERVSDEAQKRGLRQLYLKPSTRNIAALHCGLSAGFDALSHVTLTKDLTSSDRWRDGIDLQSLRFRC